MHIIRLILFHFSLTFLLGKPVSLVFTLEGIIKAQNIAGLGHHALEKIIQPVLQPRDFIVMITAHSIRSGRQIILHTFQENLLKGAPDIFVQMIIF